MRYALAILANNLVYFEAMMRNMPKQNKNIDILVVNEIGIGDKREQLKQIADECGVEVQMFSSRIVTKACAADLTLSEDGKKFIVSYAMGMNILFQYYAMEHLGYDKVLFLDDDVLINKDLMPIFEKHDFAFFKALIGYRIGKTAYDKRLVELYGDCAAIWDKNHINSGQRLYSKRIVPKYRRMLEVFFNDEHFYAAWFLNSIGEKYYKQKSFFLDENFENCLAKKTKVLNNDMKEYTRLVFNLSLPKNLNLLRDREILHYACSKNAKIKFIEIMREAGVIK